MKVFTSCSDNYVAVYDRFYKSYCDSGLEPEELYTDRYDMPEGENGFKTANWYFALATKMTYFKEKLSTLSTDEIALFTDCDVQLFPNVTKAISSIQGLMLNKELTFMFLREGQTDQVNGGMFFARNNRSSRLVLNIVCNELRRTPPPEYGEQTVFNRLLKNSSFKWDFVPYQFVVWGKNLHDKSHEVAFHHAVCSKNVESKLEQMEDVAETISQRASAYTAQLASKGSGYQIVLCRCYEKYPEDFDPEWVGDHTIVYNKNEYEDVEQFTPPCQVISLPNVGREAHAYLYHIVENYDNLAGVTVFAQAKISDSDHLPLETYIDTNSFCALVASVGQGFHGADRWAQGDEVGFGYVGARLVEDKLKSKSMKPTTLSIGEFYDRHVDDTRPENGRCVTLFNGTFSVTRDVVHKKPLEYYSKLLTLLEDHSDPEVAHYFERTWYHQFMGPHCPEHVSKPAHGFYSVTDDEERRQPS